MAGRLIGLSFLAALGFLLLFSTTGNVSAVTFKIGYSTRLSCNGPDGVYGTLDDSCVNGAQGANSANLTADILSRFTVPAATPKYSNYAILRTFGTPSGWTLATDKQIPDGAQVGTLVSISTLALFGGSCTTTLTVTFPMYDCTTDNSSGNLLAWNELQNGKNMLEGPKGGLPKGCIKYPAYLNDAAGGLKPRARYFGTTVVTDNMDPTQLQFAMFTSDQLSQLGAPQASIKDEQGYTNFVLLNNPAVPAPAGDSLDEFCTPLLSDTTLWGKTGGMGGLTQQIGPLPTNPPPTAAGNFWVVGDACNNTTDDDGDSVINEGCGIVRVKNPAANKGVWGTGTHLDGAYAESYRDADGDTIVNNEDECPFQADNGVDNNHNFVDSVCDSLESGIPLGPNGNCASGSIQDCDNDGWRNQQDNCPLVAQTTQSVDTDGDFIGDPCDTVAAGGNGPSVADGKFLNDQPGGGICIGAADSDKDAAVNDGCPTVSSHSPVWSEGGAWCGALGTGNSVDEDGDTVVDDGCTGGPAVNGISEAANHCNDAVNDDPTDDSVVNDGCPTVANIAETVAAGQCSNATDDETDGDGWCDATEDIIPAGSAQKLSDKTSFWSVPEYKALDYAIVAAASPQNPGAAPRTCDNWSYYSGNSGNAHGGVAPEVDDDGDTQVNAADPNCATLANDQDQDGVPDATDNCISVWNPTQLDTDGGCTTAVPETAGQCGDACDIDDDNDNINDTVEWAAGNDAKNVCDPINFDTKPSGTIGAADLIAFTKPLQLPNRPCNPPVNYNVCR